MTTELTYIVVFFDYTIRLSFLYVSQLYTIYTNYIHCFLQRHSMAESPSCDISVAMLRQAAVQNSPPLVQERLTSIPYVVPILPQVTVSGGRIQAII